MITRAADYAVRVLIHLAMLPEGERVQRAALAEAAEVPDSFMSKVLQALVRARLVTSRRGSIGGFELAVNPAEITLLRVVEAIDGPIRLNICVGSLQGCHRGSWCGAHTVWAEAQAAVSRVLSSATVASMAEETRRRREAGATIICDELKPFATSATTSKSCRATATAD